MIALLQQLPSETTIRKELRRIVFGKNITCPFCRSRRVYHSEGRYRCQRCRAPFSVLSGTWLANMKLHLRTFYALLWCWTQQVPVRQTKKLCQVSEVSVYHWFRQFRLHLPDYDPLLQGSIQMDEAYCKKLSLIMAKQVESKQCAYHILAKPSVDKHEALRFLYQYVQPRSTLNTDGSRIYSAIEKRWPLKHRKDIHKRWEFGKTSEIEGLFGNLRTFIRRMYHHATPEYLPEYVSEFCLRFSSPELFDSPLSYLTKTLSSVPTC